MLDRLVLHFDIAHRQPELRDFVAPDDFILARRDTPVPFPDGALAYCADLQAERVLFTVHGRSLPAVFDAPFMFAEQLRSAEHVVTVPFEQLDRFPSAEPMTPTLIFSPGRTGSTLLIRLLAACGAPCASEPDMLAQISRFVREDRMRIGLDMERMIFAACLNSLARSLGPAPFIKLRSHCNGRPMPLLEAAGHPRIVFMARNVQDWALSRHRAFGESPESVAHVLRQALDAFDKLSGSGLGVQIVLFEDLRRDPLDCLMRLLGPGRADPGVMTRVLAEDSQAGTMLSRKSVGRVTGDPGFQAEFGRAWSEARTGAEWSKPTQDLMESLAGSI